MYQLFTIVLLLGAHLAHQTLDKWAWSGAELGPVQRRAGTGAQYRAGPGPEPCGGGD